MLRRLIVLFLVVSHGISLTKSQEGGHIVNNKTQTSTLDQIFTSDSDIIKQTTSGPPLRGSDHLTATLEVKLYDNVEYLASKKFNWAKCDHRRTGNFWPGGAVNYLPKKFSQVAQTFTKQ